MTRDAIIVLGGGIDDKGVLSDNPKLRLNKAIELYRESVAPRIIVSGRWGFWLDGDLPKTEAQAMKEYLIENGVPDEDIIKEEDSMDTLGNAYFCRVNILEPNNWKRIIIISSDYHILRTEYIFNKVMGPEFDLDFAFSVSGFPEDVMKAKETKEAKSLEILKKIGDPIPDGDLAVLKHFMDTKHPGYSKNPEISKEELAKMIGRR